MEASLCDSAGEEGSKGECPLWLSRLKNIYYPLHHFAEEFSGKKKKKMILKYMTKELILHIIPDNISVLSLTLWEILI